MNDGHDRLMAYAQAIARGTPGSASRRAGAQARWIEFCMEIPARIDCEIEIVLIPIKGAGQTLGRIRDQTADRIATTGKTKIKEYNTDHETTHKAEQLIREKVREAVKTNERARTIAKAAETLEGVIENTMGERASWWYTRAGQTPNLVQISRERWRQISNGPAWLTALAVQRMKAKVLHNDPETWLQTLWKNGARQQGKKIKIPDRRTIMETIRNWRFDATKPPLGSVYACATDGFVPEGDREWGAAIELNNYFAKNWGHTGTARKFIQDEANDIIEDIESAIEHRARKRWRKILEQDVRNVQYEREEMERRWKKNTHLKAIAHRLLHLDVEGPSGEVAWIGGHSTPTRLFSGAINGRKMSEITRLMNETSATRYTVEKKTRVNARPAEHRTRSDKNEGAKLAKAVAQTMKRENEGRNRMNGKAATLENRLKRAGTQVTNCVVGPSARAAAMARWATACATAPDRVLRSMRQTYIGVGDEVEIDKRLAEAAQTALNLMMRESVAWECMETEDPNTSRKIQNKALYACIECFDATQALVSENALTIELRKAVGSIKKRMSKMEDGQNRWWWKIKATKAIEVSQMSDEAWTRLGQSQQWIGARVLRDNPHQAAVSREEDWVINVLVKNGDVRTQSKLQRQKVRDVIDQWRWTTSEPPLLVVKALALEGETIEGEDEWGAACEMEERGTMNETYPETAQRIKDRSQTIRNDVERGVRNIALERFETIDNAKRLQKGEHAWRNHPVTQALGNEPLRLQVAWPKRELVWRAQYTNISRLVAGNHDRCCPDALAHEISENEAITIPARARAPDGIVSMEKVTTDAHEAHARTAQAVRDVAKAMFT